MSKRFSIKLYTGFELVKYEEETFYDENTGEVDFSPQSEEYCLIFTDFSFNLDITKPLFERNERKENINEHFIENNLNSNTAKRKDLLVNRNKAQFKIVLEKLAKWETHLSLMPHSLTALRRVQFLHSVKSEFLNWFQNRGVDMDGISSLLIENSKEATETEITPTMKLAPFMHLILKRRKVKKYLESKESYSNKVKYVEDLIKTEKKNIKYNNGTLRRYIKDDKIKEFIRKNNSKKNPKIP